MTTMVVFLAALVFLPTKLTEAATTPPATQPASMPTSGPTSTRGAVLKDPELQAYIAGLNPPTVDDIIRSLEPIPTLDECVAPTANDPASPWRRPLKNVARYRGLQPRLGMFQLQCRYAEAASLAEEIATLREVEQGADHWETQNARRTTSILRRVSELPPDQRERFCSLIALDKQVAELRRQEKHGPEVELAWQRLRICLDITGDPSADVAESLQKLGEILRDADEHKSAERVFRAALARYQDVCGRDHPDFIWTLLWVASELRDTKDYDAAEMLFRKALAMTRRTLGDLHQNISYCLTNLADCMRARALGMLEEHNESLGRSLMRHSVDLRQSCRFESDEHAAECRREYAGSLRKAKSAASYAEAEAVLLETLKAFETDLVSNELALRNRLLDDLGALYGRAEISSPAKLSLIQELRGLPAHAAAEALIASQSCVWPPKRLAGADAFFYLLGEPQEFRVVNWEGNVDVEPASGRSPARIKVTARQVGLHPFRVQLDVGGIPVTAEGCLLATDWHIRHFVWAEPSSAQAQPKDWETLVTGQPAAEARIQSLNLMWGGGSPASGVPKDKFATVATTTVDLPGQQYELWTAADDGVRVWIDDRLILDAWAGSATREKSEIISLDNGPHTFHVEHFENAWHAQLLFGLSPVASTLNAGVAPPPLMTDAALRDVAETRPAVLTDALITRARVTPVGALLDPTKAGTDAGGTASLPLLSHLRVRTLTGQIASLVKQERYHRAASLGRDVERVFREQFGPEHPQTRAAAMLLWKLQLLASSSPSERRMIVAEENARQEVSRDATVFDLETYLIAIDPPTIKELISSLEPVPTLDELLAPVPDGIDAPYTRMMNPADRDRMNKLWQEIARLRIAGDYRGAADLAKEMVSSSQRALGSDHWQTIDASSHLGLLEQVASMPVTQQQEIEGAESLQHRATQAMLQGKSQDAIPMLARASGINLRLLGTHAKTLQTLRGLADCYLASGQDIEAERLYGASLMMALEVCGQEHPEVTVILGRLVTLLSRQGNHAEARMLQHKLLGIIRRLHGEQHEYFTTGLVSLASDYFTAGDYRECESLVQKELAIHREREGEYTETAVMRLSGLAMMLLRQKDYDRAERFQREALRISRIVYNQEHRHVASQVRALGFILESKGDDNGAANLYQQALSMRRKLLGSDHPEVADSLEALANLYLKVDNFKQAESLYREAIAIRRETSEYKDLLSMLKLTMNLRGLASCLISKNDVDAAEELYREAFQTCEASINTSERLLAGQPADLARQNTVTPLLVVEIELLGSAMARLGNYIGAERCYRKSLEITCKLYGPTHEQTATRLRELGNLFYRKGDYAQAEPLLRQALAMHRSLLDADHPELIESQASLGVLLALKRDFATAESLLRRALAGRRKNLGMKSLEVASILENLAWMFVFKGDPEQAEALFHEALQIQRESPDAEDFGLACSMTYLAYLAQRSGNHARAEDLFREALDILRRTPKVRILLPDSLSGLASCLIAQREFDEARKLLQESLEINRELKGQDSFAVAADLFGLANLWEKQRDYGRAESFYRQSMAICDKLRTRIVGAERERAYFLLNMTMPFVAVRWARALLNLNQPADAFQALERGRGRAFLDLLARADVDLIRQAENSMDPEAAADWGRTLTAEVAARTACTKAEAHLAAIESRQDLTADEKRELVAAQTEAVRRSRELSAEAEAAVLATLHKFWPETKPMGVQQIRTSLEPGEVVLGYSWLPPASFMLIVVPATGGGPVKGFLLAESEQSVRLLTLLARLRRDLEEPNRLAEKSHDIRDLGIELGESLFPVEIRGQLLDAKRLIVLPDGPLVGIPFSVLMPGSAGATETHRMLLEGGPELLYAESATVYVNLRKKGLAKRARSAIADSRPSALVLGNPAFHNQEEKPDNREEEALIALARSNLDKAAAHVSATDWVRLHGGRLDSLPGTMREAYAIDDMIKAAGGLATMLVGQEATMGRLESSVEGKRFVHFATHGMTGSRERPYDASLALTQPDTPTPEDIGFLTLDHLIRKWRGKLKDCELVVLSACDTQRGVRAGDSMMALPWGFMYAGAPTVIASLWKVDDTATMLLMTRFYENLLAVTDEPRSEASLTAHPRREMTKGQALREAKLWLRSLTAAEIRTLLDIRSDEKWAEFLATLGYRGFDVNETVQAAATRPATPDVSDDTLLFMHPHYWAAFILIGDPE